MVAEGEDGIEAIVTEVEEEVGATTGERELCQPTIVGRRTLRIATMAREAVVAVAAAGRKGGEVEGAAVESDTATTGRSLSPETRGWKRNSSTKATDHLASILTGE